MIFTDGFLAFPVTLWCLCCRKQLTFDPHGLETPPHPNNPCHKLFTQLHTHSTPLSFLFLHIFFFLCSFFSLMILLGVESLPLPPLNTTRRKRIGGSEREREKRAMTLVKKKKKRKKRFSRKS